MTDSPPEIDDSPSDKLPPSSTIGKMNFATKLAYGAGDAGAAITSILLLSYLSPFLTDVAHLSPGLAGQSQLVGKFWDAVNDPMVGVLSDRGQLFSDKIRKRWGRRYPWMLWGAIPFGLFFALQWIVPFPETNQLGLFAFYTLISILFNTFFTVVNLPYTALTAELTADYNERTSLSTFRFTFSLGGSIVALLIARTIFQQPLDPATQYLTIGTICAVLSVFPLFWCVFGTIRRAKAVAAEHPAELEPVMMPMREQLRLVFTNRPFLLVVGIYLCSWFSLQLTAAIIPYFVVSYMGLKQADSPLVILAVQGTALAMLSVWNAISQKVGKKVVYFVGTGFWIVAQLGLYSLQPGQTTLMYIFAVMAGLGVSTAYLVPWSMLPDVIELDELRTGQRREGIFYSFMVFLQKICLGLAVAGVLQSLERTGYRLPTADIPIPIQPVAVLDAIRLSIGPIPILSLICGLVCAYFYPITREMHQQIVLQLQERREQQN
ncbi:MFS transporter [Chamaesiphon sp. OTE_20_metabat_361]|uniref:MFS transporter n=1 Tax=Chamaesiphon sp. OTE_20_metabat_361 TaxID=2964689 RepID=UPI00286CBA35|nr:MFS transporter [Chamaesiphon sp. OTE_20_metabat_361]